MQKGAAAVQCVTKPNGHVLWFDVAARKGSLLLLSQQTRPPFLFNSIVHTELVHIHTCEIAHLAQSVKDIDVY